MKILKHGDIALIDNKKHVHYFTCNYCHCEFTADESEYTSDSIILLGSELSFGTAICPECKEEVCTTWRL